MKSKSVFLLIFLIFLMLVGCGDTTVGVDVENTNDNTAKSDADLYNDGKLTIMDLPACDTCDGAENQVNADFYQDLIAQVESLLDSQKANTQNQEIVIEIYTDAISELNDVDGSLTDSERAEIQFMIDTALSDAHLNETV